MTMRPALPELTVLLAGLLWPLAFAPFGYAGLTIVSLALLFNNWYTATVAQAVRRGYIFGLGLFGFGISFVYISLHDYRGLSTVLAVCTTVVMVLYFSLFTGLAGGLSVYCFRKNPQLRLLLIFPVVWVAVEWLRSWFFIESPWLQAGYSQTDTALSGLAPVLGVYGISGLLALTAAALVTLYTCQSRVRLAPIVVCLLLWLGCVGLGQMQWARSAGTPFQVTLVQGNIPQNLKWASGFREETLKRYLSMTRQHWDSDLLIWPETAVPAYYHEVKASLLTALQQEARQHRSDLLIGIPFKHLATGQRYNALLSLGARGEAFYLKRRLVPLGEYLPLQPVSNWIRHHLRFSAPDIRAGSDQQALLHAAGYALAASICYEDAFGAVSRVGLPEAAYLVNVTNDAWFNDSLEPHQHLQMARMRALETGRYLLRATNTGVTAIIDPEGRIIRSAPQFQQAAVTGLVYPMTGSTPYVRYGDGLVLGMLVLGVLLTAVMTRPRSVGILMWWAVRDSNPGQMD